MSPVYVPPPQPQQPPYNQVGQPLSNLPASQRDAQRSFMGLPTAAPPFGTPGVRICIADTDKVTRIWNLPPSQRQVAVQRLINSCLSQLGVAQHQKTVSVHTQFDVSGLFLIISFLELTLLTVGKVAMATKELAESAEAWASVLTRLPAAQQVLRRAVGLGHPLDFNLPMLVTLTINYARSNNYGPSKPIDVCYIEPVQIYISNNASMRPSRDTACVLTCDGLPRPHTLHGFIVARTGAVLAVGETVQPPRSKSPPYKSLENPDVIERKLDIKRSEKIASKLPKKFKNLRRPDLRVGLLYRAPGEIYLFPGKNSIIEIDCWPPMNLTTPSAEDFLIS